MKTKNLYIALMSILFIIIGVGIYFLWHNEVYYLLTAEIVFFLLVSFSFVLYKRLFRPLEIIEQGVATLKANDYNLQFVKTGSSDVDQLVSVYNELMARLREEKTSMIEQNFFLNLLMNKLPVGILIMDFDNKIIEFNSEASKFVSNIDAYLGQTIKSMRYSFIGKIDLQNENSQIYRIDGYRQVRVHVGSFVQRGFQRRFVVLEELTNVLHQTERKAYDKVIRMMAHEVNNSIGAINSILDSLTKMHPIKKDELNPYLEVAMNRNHELNSFMQNFADVVRIPHPELQEVNVMESLKNLILLYENTLLEEQFLLVDEIENLEWLIKADPKQLHQIFVNVMKNAMEAATVDRQITIRTDVNRHMIQFRDMGPEISDEVLKNMFTPFYSTKPKGQGIGMTIIKEILQNHNFSFDFRRENNETVFEIFTP